WFTARAEMGARHVGFDDATGGFTVGLGEDIACALSLGVTDDDLAIAGDFFGLYRRHSWQRTRFVMRVSCNPVGEVSIAIDKPQRHTSYGSPVGIHLLCEQMAMQCMRLDTANAMNDDCYRRRHQQRHNRHSNGKSKDISALPQRD